MGGVLSPPGQSRGKKKSDLLPAVVNISPFITWTLFTNMHLSMWNYLSDRSLRLWCGTFERLEYLHSRLRWWKMYKTKVLRCECSRLSRYLLRQGGDVLFLKSWLIFKDLDPRLPSIVSWCVWIIQIRFNNPGNHKETCQSNQSDIQQVINQSAVLAYERGQKKVWKRSLG